MRCLTMRSRYDRLVPGRTALGTASPFCRNIMSAEACPQANRGINATTSTKTKELLRFIPFFVAFYCLFFLGGHITGNYIIIFIYTHFYPQIKIPIKVLIYGRLTYLIFVHPPFFFVGFAPNTINHFSFKIFVLV